MYHCNWTNLVCLLISGDLKKSYQDLMLILENQLKNYVLVLKNSSFLNNLILIKVKRLVQDDHILKRIRICTSKAYK